MKKKKKVLLLFLSLAAMTLFGQKVIDEIIAVVNEEQWKSLCGVIGNNSLMQDPRFVTLLARKRNEDELDAIIGAWTAGLTAEEVMEKMQSAGVPAGVVQNAGDVYNDPQLRHREAFWELVHPEIGKSTHLGSAFRLSGTPAQGRTPSPCLGEHTEQVCHDFLNLSDEEFVQLTNEGVFE